MSTQKINQSNEFKLYQALEKLVEQFRAKMKQTPSSQLNREILKNENLDIFSQLRKIMDNLFEVAIGLEQQNKFHKEIIEKHIKQIGTIEFKYQKEVQKVSRMTQQVDYYQRIAATIPNSSLKTKKVDRFYKSFDQQYKSQKNQSLQLETFKTQIKGIVELKSDNDQQTGQNTEKFKMQIDPYYSHFVLTSQAVKIRQDCQELLNVNIKSYYQEIVQNRIPMHLWDQWISNRLKECIKKIKRQKSKTSSML